MKILKGDTRVKSMDVFRSRGVRGDYEYFRREGDTENPVGVQFLG